MTPTLEQQLIVAAAESSSNNLMIQALAGCGKTSTLEMIAKSKPWSSALALAFNVKTKKELERRFPKNFEIMTLNGLGHRAWQKAIEPRLQLDERKLGKLISEVARKMQVNLGEEGWDNARRLISLVMSKGIIPAKFKRSGLQLDTNEAWAEIADDNWLDITDDLIDFCRIVLTESIYASYNGNISYDDQIYMSCQPAGTKVHTLYGEKNIEDIKEQEMVISFDRKTSKFIGSVNSPTVVDAIALREYTGRLFTVTTQSHKETKATLEHKWLVRFSPIIVVTKEYWFTYIMRQDNKWRIGYTQLRSKRPAGYYCFGLAARTNLERADSAWILGVHEHEFAAKIEEATLVAEFGITDVCFGSSLGIAVHNTFKDFDMTKRAIACLNAYKRDIRFPFLGNNKTRAFDTNFIIESCNLIPEVMELPTYNGSSIPNWEQFSLKDVEVNALPVYSLKVHRHELYIANGILTHNSLFGGIFPRFDTVFVDEAQDLSPLNHLQVKRCAANRIIAVGDPHQALYAFRGADHSSMDNLRRLRQEWKDLTLGMTFRCPKVIVARQPIDNFRAASNAPQGEILDSVWNNTFGSCEEQGGKDITWCWEDVPRIIDNKVSSIAVICRNNAPLLKLAFKLIRKGIGCQMLGREIGKGLIALSKKLCKDDKILSKECIVIITEWLEQQTNLARVNGQDGKIAGLQDRAECLIAVLETSGCADAGGLRYAIDNIFAQESGQVVLTTIHKAKGLEWDIVLHLDPWRVPSKYARKQEKEGNGKPMEQECNAKYVCETRTKHTLILANLDTFV